MTDETANTTNTVLFYRPVKGLILLFIEFFPGMEPTTESLRAAARAEIDARQATEGSRTVAKCRVWEEILHCLEGHPIESPTLNAAVLAVIDTLGPYVTPDGIHAMAITIRTRVQARGGLIAVAEIKALEHGAAAAEEALSEEAAEGVDEAN